MTTYLVIDASFAFKLITPNVQQPRCKNLMTSWAKSNITLCAPTLWLYEITSALSKAVHFKALTATEGRKVLQLAQKLNVQLVQPDTQQTQLAFDWTLRLKRMAAYDSFYLALAETLNAELWSADKRLYNAADQSWVNYIGD